LEVVEWAVMAIFWPGEQRQLRRLPSLSSLSRDAVKKGRWQIRWTKVSDVGGKQNHHRCEDGKRRIEMV